MSRKVRIRSYHLLFVSLYQSAPFLHSKPVPFSLFGCDPGSYFCSFLGQFQPRVSNRDPVYKCLPRSTMYTGSRFLLIGAPRSQNGAQIVLLAANWHHPTATGIPYTSACCEAGCIRDPVYCSKVPQGPKMEPKGDKKTPILSFERFSLALCCFFARGT